MRARCPSNALACQMDGGVGHMAFNNADGTQDLVKPKHYKRASNQKSGPEGP